MKNDSKNLLTLKTPYGTYKVSLGLDTYADNKRLAILITDWEDGEEEPFAPLTVNIPDEAVSGANCNFVDTNNLPYICTFIEENNLGKSTGRFASSGYCTYPEYQFNIDEIKKYI